MKYFKRFQRLDKQVVDKYAIIEEQLKEFGR